MEPMVIEGTPKTPSVKFDPVDGLFEIKGRSHPENAKLFYKPLINWMEEYVKDPRDTTIVNVQLEHFNTSSSKCILDVLKQLEAIYRAKFEVLVNWHYERDDEDILEAGEDYESFTRIPFKMIEL
jgi:hypothetical protein